MSSLSEPGNFLSKDVEIEGTLSFATSLAVHGKVVGDVRSSGVLTLGETGVIEGDITAGSVTIYGLVKGDVTVTNRCELRGAGRLLGDLVAPRLIMEDGATFVGTCKVGPIAQQEAVPRTRAA
jgi:cytoskeletal protein CcmA (bactofilin family)